MLNEGEICREYQQAKNKNRQIEILAELNATKPQVILDILQANGCISGLTAHLKQKPKQGERQCAKWDEAMEKELRSLLEQGISNLEIAERLGVSEGAVRGKLTALGLTRKGLDVLKNRTEEALLAKTLEQPDGFLNEGVQRIRDVLEKVAQKDMGGILQNMTVHYQEGRLHFSFQSEDFLYQATVQIEKAATAGTEAAATKR